MMPPPSSPTHPLDVSRSFTYRYTASPNSTCLSVRWATLKSFEPTALPSIGACSSGCAFLPQLEMRLGGDMRGDPGACCSLWPRTAIATAAVANLLGGAESVRRSRHPEIMADAAVAVLSSPPATCS